MDIKTDRRALLRGAALTGAFGAMGGCNPGGDDGGQNSGAEDDLTTKTIAAAEKLQGIEYTPQERAMMLDDIEQRLTTLAALRAIEFPNELAPACVFDPKLPRKKIPSQKNRLNLSEVTRDLPQSEADIAFASVVEQGHWLRAGAITSAQLTDIYLRRIEKYNGTLNAYITVTADLARAQAAKADVDFAEGRDRGPLQGIPYGLKDLADTKNVLTSWGAMPYKDRFPETDAEVTRKLRRAGAVLLGKTACGAIAYGDQWFAATTRNPWYAEEGSSGSSAGSASAVAGGLCAFSIGTETLGSIISPSERCGTTGLRPTFGRVSRAGFMALCWSLDKVGPICRTVEDNAAVLSAINGFDADDPSAARVGFTYEPQDITKMTVGFVPAWFEEGDSADRKALEALKDIGVTLKEFPWPEIDFGSLIEIVQVEAAAAFADLTLSNRDDELVWQAKEAWPNAWRAARFVSAVDYVQIDRLRRRLMQDMMTAFEGFDALIGPHFAGGALLATNATGHPQLALRAGFSQRPALSLFDEPIQKQTFKAPRGISLWADLFEERKILALGAALEKKLSVSDQRPPNFD
ncbi:amidase [Hyphococcus sp. DH-69]|uniref:amidase n=1 Tax=Hyphococcus formosus TaxID=3143534 RepID=UPI00398ADB51